jgi:hypothetical protein
MVTGHRLWCDAADEDERFLALDSIDFMKNSQQKTLWIDFRVGEDNLTALNLTHATLLTNSRLAQGWTDVKGVTNPATGHPVVDVRRRAARGILRPFGI